MMSPCLDQGDESLPTEFNSTLSTAFDLAKRILKKKSKLNNTANYISVPQNITYFLRSKCKLQVTFYKTKNKISVCLKYN